jgi:hypothetical protein
LNRHIDTESDDNEKPNHGTSQILHLLSSPP